MQPMDVAVYDPLKTHFEREVNIFQKSHLGRITSTMQLGLLAPAFLKTAVAINAVHGFERPGIWPINKHAFGNQHFAPAEVLVGTSTSSSQTATLSSLGIIALPESAVQASPSIDSHDQPTLPSLANATQQSDSVLSHIQEGNTPILESINPLFRRQMNLKF
ncbi:unnamed protein product [Acanthoscelides obtectus]|uniref:Uncharacterized protein n=1 Tax=Acanthoscelides obtectus TaxID=200917 RepID=A0A9P0K6P3_ACAOB|nr:unnamed protein product [Acanthoscelides obtectus]CAK1673421.1 hypothetical protein AOBTE_LOCUS29332 [Acanthoscelides obtectus]